VTRAWIIGSQVAIHEQLVSGSQTIIGPDKFNINVPAWPGMAGKGKNEEYCSKEFSKKGIHTHVCGSSYALQWPGIGPG